MSSRMIVICAPSGTGKSTLLNRLKADIPDLVWSVSCTTRPMRTGETHGKDYFFIKVESFEKQIADDEFIEWAKVHSNYYGTSKRFVSEGIQKGHKMLFDLDVQGADAMKRIYGADAQVIFIEPPSVEELEKRLIARGTDALHVIQERIKNAREELKNKHKYDHLILNDNVDSAYEKLKAVVEKILS
ncbi:guanylate kinase [Peredibacter starrii]|uniref:Guanylate kinase n=1 Tax=Peredibacter starrii TaxID=28202 RepID=A0AAX4HNA7_9BACT|nr:guanylate kinase [Peredibacter starrii]WPU64774.1 guanylate kinase [Peredibacter starrii]